jgi:hypothetical protein
LIPHDWEEKDTIEGILRICARPPHQMGHTLNNQKESKKQATPFDEKQK